MLNKIIVGVVGFVGAFVATSNMTASLLSSGNGSGSRTPTRTLAEDLKREVQEVNKQRGQKKGAVVIEGARLNGHTLIVDMIVPDTARRYDLTRTSEKIQSQTEKEMCKKYAAVFKRGAAVMFIYKTSSGLELFDSRVDAGICRIPV